MVRDIIIWKTAFFEGTEADKTVAAEIVDNVKCIVMENWQGTAEKHGISCGEIERMRPAFEM